MNFTITTPLYYVNADPHLGSTYTTLACDAIARYQRLEGNNVCFITGVDEHGQKIQQTAEDLDIPPQVHCNNVTSNYLNLWNNYQISNDRFIRTSNSNHEKVVRDFFEQVEKAGDIYIGQQQGWYCVACEEYKEQLDGNDNHRCPIHQRELEWRDEENLFFRLSKYQGAIENLVNDPTFIQPPSRRKEIVNFVKNGLNDFSISRINLKWGIPVPNYHGHTFYVWFDALVGYLTALLDNGHPVDMQGLHLTQSGWPASVHVIGKDILRFHAVYWPAMLMSAGLKLPVRVFGHGFLTREGQKMGKTIGNIINPGHLLNTYGDDAIRWYLLKDIHFGNDGDFQHKRLLDIVNNDLANTIGNLLNRTSSMARRWFDDTVPSPTPKDLAAHPLRAKAEETIIIYKEAMNNLAIHQAANCIVELATFANCHLNEVAPWKLVKEDTKLLVVSTELYAVLETCRIFGHLLYPLVPTLSCRLHNQLDCQSVVKDWESCLQWGGLIPHSKLPVPIPIMSKLEEKEI